MPRCHFSPYKRSFVLQSLSDDTYQLTAVWLSDLVVSALGIPARGPGFESRVAPLFHWVATLGKLFTHIAFPVSQLQETGVQKGSFRRLSGYDD